MNWPKTANRFRDPRIKLLCPDAPSACAQPRQSRTARGANQLDKCAQARCGTQARIFPNQPNYGFDLLYKRIFIWESKQPKNDDK